MRNERKQGKKEEMRVRKQERREKEVRSEIGKKRKGGRI